VIILAFLLLISAPPAEPPPTSVSTDQPGAVDWDKEFGVVRKERDPVTGEIPLDPYPQRDANAGAVPFKGEALVRAFGGKDGIRRVTDRTIDLSVADPRIKAIFVEHDLVRLRRTLFEQVCFILGAGCSYSGRDMGSAHKGLGTTRGDIYWLV
jgi:hemoglobin